MAFTVRSESLLSKAGADNFSRAQGNQMLLARSDLLHLLTSLCLSPSCGSVAFCYHLHMGRRSLDSYSNMTAGILYLPSKDLFVHLSLVEIFLRSTQRNVCDKDDRVGEYGSSSEHRQSGNLLKAQMGHFFCQDALRTVIPQISRLIVSYLALAPTCIESWKEGKLLNILLLPGQPTSRTSPSSS